MNPTFFKLLLNLYPPYWGTGISVKYVAPDYREIIVQMKLRWYNRNYVNTHFGGSLYAMADPFFMLMLIRVLGKGFVVWDKAAHVDFVKPGKGKVTARFLIQEEDITAILHHTADGQKHLPAFSVEIKDEIGETVVKVVKTLYVRRKNFPRR